MKSDPLQARHMGATGGDLRGPRVADGQAMGNFGTEQESTR
ncbi:hypothetical protein [Candidatus Thiosymbion oneisti]|nr:hypothetical protein [Candidatus Thiosymbion oneisti]